MYYTLGTSSEVLQTNKNIFELIKALQNQKLKILATSTDTVIHDLDEYKDSNPRRDFVVIPFDSDQLNDVRQILDTVFDNPTHLIYQANSKKCRLIIALAKEIGNKRYRNLVKNLAKQFQTSISQGYYSITHPIIINKLLADDVIEMHEGKLLNVAFEMLDNDDRLMPNQNKMILATQSFLSTKKAAEMLKNEKEAYEFIDSLANSYLDKMLNQAYINKTMLMISKVTGYDVREWRQMFDDRLKLLQSNQDLKENVKPFGHYIRLSSQAKNSNNVAKQLKALLPKDVKPDEDYELSEAGKFIEMVYPPYLLNRPGDDVDNLVIFNSESGYWTNDDNILRSLLIAVKPFSSNNQYDTFKTTFAAKARNADRFITPYSGSRYLLFNNCMLDVKTMRQYSLDDPLVTELHFTQRSKINIDYIENPALPQIPKMNMDGTGPWNPQDFLMGYANNNHEQYIYLCFCLALGLFGGHNFVVHVDIKGGSRVGKTILSTIYKSLYNNRIAIINFPDLNTQFPFTDYKIDNSLIWIKENNVGTEPLNDTYGTTYYDGLGDDDINMHVKGKGDITVVNPPQVYVDGTQFIKAQELYTGPAGRTLAYKLPVMTDELRQQSYSANIRKMFRNEKVLQWMVYQFIEAYREVVPKSRMDNFTMNLAIKKDLHLLPQIALNWRKEFVVGGSTIDDWFNEEIRPYLSADPKHPTYLHARVLYEMYMSHYKLANPNDPFAHNIKHADDFMRRLKTVWDSEDDIYQVSYEVGSREKGRDKPRKLVADPSKMNFDWDRYDLDFERPDGLKSPGYRNLKIFGKKSSDWIAIVKKKDPDD